MTSPNDPNQPLDNQKPTGALPQSQASGQTPPAGPNAPSAATPAGAPQSQKTNTMSIVALISAFVIPLVAIILGHISLSQIKRTGEKGRGLALAGTILGYVFTALYVITFIIIFASVGWLASQRASEPASEGTTQSEIAPGTTDEAAPGVEDELAAEPDPEVSTEAGSVSPETCSALNTYLDTALSLDLTDEAGFEKMYVEFLDFTKLIDDPAQQDLAERILEAVRSGDTLKVAELQPQTGEIINNYAQACAEQGHLQ